MDDRFIKKLISSVQCNECEKHYQIDNIKIIVRQGDTWFLNVTCPACQRHSFIIAIIKRDNTSDTITDLTDTELVQFAGTSINTDDILDLHDFLNGFNGDFIKIFSQISGNEIYPDRARQY